MRSVFSLYWMWKKECNIRGNMQCMTTCLCTSRVGVRWRWCTECLYSKDSIFEQMISGGHYSMSHGNPAYYELWNKIIKTIHTIVQILPSWYAIIVTKPPKCEFLKNQLIHLKQLSKSVIPGLKTNCWQRELIFWGRSFPWCIARRSCCLGADGGNCVLEPTQQAGANDSYHPTSYATYAPVELTLWYL